MLVRSEGTASRGPRFFKNAELNGYLHFIVAMSTGTVQIRPTARGVVLAKASKMNVDELLHDERWEKILSAGEWIC